MDIQQLSLILSIVSIILVPVSLLLGIFATVKVLAVEKSTHTVHMVPVDEEIDRANEEYLAKWSTSSSSIDKENKLYQEELEDEMPEFALTDEDKEIMSI